ncbi:hypothetical protein RJ640_005143 [Escallonia rubra]|uniref:DUF632 domain-containing protein n=1 Tax=Escallonia rubra TaxID=112253 RepID=A0AA88UQA8_9ASTE|nr:hypothetical protein RJ640_005143 [Escallonia rubra]
MWTLMIECHKKQFQVIMEAKVQVTQAGKRSSSLKAAQNLELEILKWGSSFTEWINTQKVFVKNLNRWLLRCLLQGPGETEDGNAFFSSSRQGTPSIFIICNDWYCSIENISGDGVLEAIHDFASMLRQLWEKLNEEKHQRLKAEYLSRDLEKRLQSLRNRSHVNWDQCALLNNSGTSGSTDTRATFPDKVLEDVKSIRDRLNEANEKHKEVIKEVDDSVCHCFQGGLVPIFEALWRFSSDMTEAYKGVSFPVQGSTDCAF